MPTRRDRQHELMRHLAGGASMDEAAHACGLKRQTAKQYAWELYKALGVRNCTAAVALLMQTGELVPDNIQFRKR